MTEPQLIARIEYCEILRNKHVRLSVYFNVKLAEYQEDLERMTTKYPRGRIGSPRA